LSDDVVTSIGEWNEVVEQSLDLKEDPNARLTHVYVYYGIINPAGDIDDPSNYSLRHIAADPEAASDRMYGGKRIKTIFSRWISASNAVAAIDLGEKYLYRFRQTPRRAGFLLDEKDGAIKPGDFVQLSTWRSQKADGSSEPVNIQILSRKFRKVGTQVQYEGSEFFYLEPQTGPSGQVERLVVIAAPVTNGLNLRDLHDSIYADLKSGDVVRFRILEDVYVTGGTHLINVPACDTGAWPTGVGLYLDMLANSYVCGYGGRGASWNWFGGVVNGQQGGTALRVQHALNISFASGARLYGGRGGGAAVARCTSSALTVTGSTRRAGGGGGHARPGAAVGTGGNGYDLGGSGIIQVPGPVPSGTTINTDTINYNAARDGGIVAMPGNVIPAQAGVILYGDGGQSKDLLNIITGSFPHVASVQAGASGTFAAFAGAGGYPKFFTMSDFFTVNETPVPASGTYNVPGYGNLYLKVLAPGDVGNAIEGAALVTATGTDAAVNTDGRYGNIVA
jgi:hypothetical protein